MPKGRVSSVWQHYDINEECENFAVCRYCGNNISRGGMASNLKGNNTTNLWTHLRHKHSDEVLVNPVQQRTISRPSTITIKKEKTSRIAKAKVVREPLRVAKPKIEAHSSIAGALPQKWEEYEQNEEISEDIKDIIYSEDPLCYSPIQVVEDEMLDTGDKVTVMSSNTRTTTAPVVATVVSATPTNAAKTLKNNLETSIERLTTVSEQLNYIIQQQQEQQTKDDDYYFALSLVPIMRQLSVSRKLYVRSKIHEILYKESEETSPKSE
ncbi:uncharacterized protein LOC132790404 isoform X1 [Drosophila nasuta]|uniref:Uncharacterized protein LOC117570516 isoform X1 n=1 Tax=Drosophila albomicans TaxID=7291 RepID=A0A6P8WWM9_DROAB|nr:uncharacterized protein LOC117570516 isoform X1 [Drosophila albomicans]XP_060654885.1 uncharacterized protein LOC132790404 isoform X1 [Drosophila nasuta]